jgi:hypothetical protein
MLQEKKIKMQVISLIKFNKFNNIFLKNIMMINKLEKKLTK